MVCKTVGRGGIVGLIVSGKEMGAKNREEQWADCYQVTCLFRG